MTDAQQREETDEAACVAWLMRLYQETIVRIRRFTEDRDRDPFHSPMKGGIYFCLWVSVI